MNADQAQEVSIHWARERRLEVDGLDAARYYEACVTRSLVALMPDVGDAWATPEVQKVADSATVESGEVQLLALVEGELWHAFLLVDDEGPSLGIRRYKTDEWDIWLILDAHASLGEPTAYRRAWSIRLKDEGIRTFSSGPVPIDGSVHEPSRDERFGRALARSKGVDIESVPRDL